MAITDVLGLMGNIIAIVFFLVPITIMINLYKSKDTDKIPYILFIFTIFNCEAWTLYGIKVDAWPIWLCNSVGLLTNHIYLTIFYFYLNISNVLKILYITSLYVSFVLSFSLSLIYINDVNTIGTIAMIWNILMFAAPLQKLIEVIKKKDNSYIPIWVSYTMMLSSIIWIAYGYYKDKDVYVIVPNSIGLAASLVQIALFYIYENNSKNLTISNTNEEFEHLNDKENKNV